MRVLQRIASGLGLIALSIGAAVAPAGAAIEATPSAISSSEVSVKAKTEPKTTVQARKSGSFWCYGTFNVVATRTFGPSDWKQQLGIRSSDGAKAVRVFHPSGRSDRFRFNNREANGSVWTTSATTGVDACIVFGGGGLAAAQPEANNGYGWKTGYWMG